MGLSTTEGPNRIKESTVYKTTDPLQPVKIRMGTEGPAADEPISIPGLLKNTVEKFASRPAIASRNKDEGWDFVTYKEYQDMSLHVAKVFIKLGLESRHSVGILAFNCPEWYYANMGAIHANGISVGIYTTNSPDAVCHVLENSRANIIVVDESKQMKKICEIKHKLPLLKAVIQIDEPFDETLKEEDGYYRWSKIREMKVGAEEEMELERRMKDIAINECCSIVYTSGTTGMPKGVMLSHDNIIWDSVNSARTCGGIVPGEEVVVSFLPLSHVAAMNCDLYIALAVGGAVYFADRTALKGTLVKTLTDARPTLFGAVPRVYEKMQEKMMAMEAKAGIAKRYLLSWARSCALDYRLGLMKGNDYEGFQYRLAKALVLNKIKYALGLDRARSLRVGAAPLSAETRKFFLSLDMHLLDIYGLSENFGGHCFSELQAPDLDTVGREMEGTETLVYNPDETGQGELCFRGRHVFMGYVDNPQGTNEALDDEGWLHTGDIGYINDDGFVYVTGRIKELIITAGGENIPPVYIENLVKKELPILSNCFLVGDKRKYLTMLVTIKTEMDLETGLPLDKLHPETLEWVESLELPYKKLAEILESGPCPKVLGEIEAAIGRANKLAISNAQKIQKFALLPNDFSIPTGELGPTLKVRRQEVLKKYLNVIEGLYRD